MEENKTIIQKVPLEALLNILEEIWNKGANFIDIIGISNPETKEDSLGIIVHKEYLEKGHDFENLDFSESNIPLSEKDLNDLI